MKMDDENNKSEMLNYYGSSSAAGGGLSEIEEEEMITFTSLHHMNEIQQQESVVYVAVGKSDTSMDALSWTINNLLLLLPSSSSSTIIYLIHVFPHIKHIPNPLGVGMVSRNQVSAEQVETYMAQERAKRRDLLHKFLHSCSISKVKVDTILIESDFVAKAILDLIPILQIQDLVIGANKFLLRKSKSRKGGNSIADEVLQNAPPTCKVRIICEGKQVNQQIIMSSSPQFIASPNHTSSSITTRNQQNDSLLCICFKPKFKL